MVSVAVIPARSGSKRIPNKNFIEVQGRSVVDHAINLASSSGLFDQIIVSVDSAVSANLISSRVADIHIRSAILASDEARTIDVVKEVIEEKRISKSINLCCLYPTSILLPSQRIVEGLNTLENNKGCFVFAAQESRTNPLRMFQIDSAKKKVLFLDEKSVKKNTQDLGTYYSDAGQFYWASSSTWCNEAEILSSSSVPVILNKWETIDVDSPEDFDMVRILLKVRERQ